MPRLTRFIALMTGATEFRVYVLQNDALKPRSSWMTNTGMPPTSRRDDPPVRRDRDRAPPAVRLRPADRTLLGDRGVLAGPLFEARPPTA